MAFRMRHGSNVSKTLQQHYFLEPLLRLLHGYLVVAPVIVTKFIVTPPLDKNGGPDNVETITARSSAFASLETRPQSQFALCQQIHWVPAKFASPHIVNHVYQQLAAKHRDTLHYLLQGKYK
jgi:hypothetical protein